LRQRTDQRQLHDAQEPRLYSKDGDHNLPAHAAERRGSRGFNEATSRGVRALFGDSPAAAPHRGKARAVLK
jgi:hypothetical protein